MFIETYTSTASTIKIIKKFSHSGSVEHQWTKFSVVVVHNINLIRESAVEEQGSRNLYPIGLI